MVTEGRLFAEWINDRSTQACLGGGGDTGPYISTGPQGPRRAGHAGNARGHMRRTPRARYGPVQSGASF
jgi:hypothetical protein